MVKLGALRSIKKAWNGLKAVVIGVNIKDHIAKRKQSVGIKVMIKRKTKKNFAKNVGLILKQSSDKPLLRIGKRSVHVTKKISHRRFSPTHVVTRLIPEANPVGRQLAYGYQAELEILQEPISSSGQIDDNEGAEKSKDIDKQAEDFIANFRQQIKLQRQRSIGEYHEMLARGTN